MKTFSDLEREAYIRGDVIIADIYSQLDQFEHDEYEIEYWRQRAVKAEGELEEAKFILESLSK